MKQSRPVDPKVSRRAGWTILQSSLALGLAAAISALLAAGTETASIVNTTSPRYANKHERLAADASRPGMGVAPIDRATRRQAGTRPAGDSQSVLRGAAIPDATASSPASGSDTTVSEEQPPAFQFSENESHERQSVNQPGGDRGHARNDPWVRSEWEWDRDAAVDELEELQQEWKASGWARARREGWEPIGAQGGEGGVELMRIRDQKVYAYGTDNADAAISSSADVAATTGSFSVSGDGVVIGIWDQGAVRDTHQELAGRVTVEDGASPASHATHAGGTLAAAGVSASAKGMAPAATLRSFNWTEDLAEMAALAMSAPGEAGTVQISSHSYGYISGWAPQYSPPRWFGSAGDIESENFGQYEWYASEWDELCYNAPYFLPFKSAGNNRIDVAPSPGSTFEYYDNGWQTKAYDPSVDPLGDGEADGGYDSIPMIGNAKNVITVGAVEDAVSGGVRSLQAAAMTSFSGWGPTDDGRIKPDIVANGTALYSSRSSSDSSYGYMTGTSMSTPSAAGSAALLVERYAGHFNGDAMPAGLLKGLIVHTADDLGNPGPDYRFGWGLMNTAGAADLIEAHAREPDALHLGMITLTNRGSRTLSLVSNGSDPIVVTICWTDPPAQPLYALDDRSPRLVHDIDLRILDPDGAEYLPFVLDAENPAANAGPGDNRVDNVEQIRIAAPPGPGAYQIVVSADGDLAYGAQDVAVITSGLSGNTASRQPPTIALNPSVQVAVDGTGLVTVFGQIQDVENDLCSLQVEYTADGGAVWRHATLSDASCTDGTLPIDNQNQTQVSALAPDGTTAFRVTWDSRNSVVPVEVSPNTRVRVRAWDGFDWSDWAATPIFLVDNLGPEIGAIGVANGDLAFDRYLVDNSATLSWTSANQDESGIAGYYVAVDGAGLDEASYTTDSKIAVTDLPFGQETIITVWAVDGFGNVGAPSSLAIYVLDPNGTWDGAEDFDTGGPSGVSRSGDADEPLTLAADVVSGTPILRWRLAPGTQYRIETCSNLADPAGWTEQPTHSFSLDDDWVVWANQMEDEVDAPGVGFFRVVEIARDVSLPIDPPQQPPTKPSKSPPPPPPPEPAFNWEAFIEWLWVLILRSLFR